MSMRTWIAPGPDGHECLYRAGIGVVSAVLDTPSNPDQCTVEILCAPPADRGKALRYTLTPQIPTSHPAHSIAVTAAHDRVPVRWRVRWQRHPWVAGTTPITLLNLEADVAAVLEELMPFPEEPAPVAAVPAHDSTPTKP